MSTVMHTVLFAVISGAVWAYLDAIDAKKAASRKSVDVTQPNLGPHRTPPTKCSECGGWNQNKENMK